MRTHYFPFLIVFASWISACSYDWDRFQIASVVPDVVNNGDVVDASFDVAKGQCRTSPDSCPLAQYCSPTLLQCVSGCRNDGDCAGMADGGAPLHCQVSTHTCVVCVDDTHCPLGQLCMGSACVDGCNPGHACPSGRTCCGSGCVDTQSNTMNCGGCGTACSIANGTPACVAGSCGVGMCIAGRGDCDMSAGNGCETDLTTSAAHCGACGRACAPFAHAATNCVMGMCRMGACEAGFEDCDSDPSNGCEINTRTDLMHCGVCRRVCAIEGADAVCTSGVCTRTRCQTGRADCDMDLTNGCEVDLTRDVTNCGRCGSACTAVHGSPSCVANSCGVSRCDSGWGNCDGVATNGCETDLLTSVSNCGTCSNICPSAGGTATCAAGTCGIGMCASGRDDCDGMVSNGCETDVRSNLRNCGRCGVVCPTRLNSTPFCTDLRCGNTCSAGFDDCDRIDANGCEADTTRDIANCGTCGRFCAPSNATGTCTSGVCRVGSCRAGFANCDGADVNGCETDTSSDISNCGGCGRTCIFTSASGTCVSGACRVTSCEGTMGNCDGNDANGCETNLVSSSANCGACGNTCGAGRTCVVGRCTLSSFAGYNFVTNPAGLAWIDACSAPGHDVILRSLDDEFWVGSTPFAVDFWGALNNHYLINTNGAVGFGTLFYNIMTPPVPAAGPLRSWGALPTRTGFAPGAYVFGIDLLTSGSGICLATVGAAPNRTWVVEYLATTGFVEVGNYTFEMLVYESNRNIDMVYNSIITPAGTSATSPGSVTVGLQDHVSFTSPRTVQYMGSITTGLRVRFAPL
jgi:hypothetical protein